MALTVAGTPATLPGQWSSSRSSRGGDPDLRQVAQAWFPGGVTTVLAEPFGHLLDVY